MLDQIGFRTCRALWRKPGRARSGQWKAAGPYAECLERRQVPALLSFPVAVSPLLTVQPSETVDRAQDLGNLSASRDVGATGTIGAGPAGAADVAWHHFTLDAPASVTFTAGAAVPGGSFLPTISLYNDDLYDFGDMMNPQGRRLLAQNEAATSEALAQVVALLGPGSYDVAVSGAGNRDFNPSMSGSGYDGSTGAYNLLISARPLAIEAGSGPVLLSSDPKPGASLLRSPLAIRLNLSGPLDPFTVQAGSTARLVFSPTGTFGDGNDVDVALSWVNFSDKVNEIQLFPVNALAPGDYRVILAGDASSGGFVLTTPSGVPFGANSNHPEGQDLSLSFQVIGIEGGTAADDTLATAHDLGDVTAAGRVQVAGALGDDPYYDAWNFDPSYNPGNDVDFYRFHINGTGSYAFLAEVFAGRVGSPLDPGIALYRVDPATHALTFIAGNNNSGNQAAATDWSNPLLLDPALFASLTAGDYVVAVSAGFNTPSPVEGQALDAYGLYNPEVSHSGQVGFGAGPYVLNLRVYPAPDPPRVVAAAPAEGSTLESPPATLSVQFTQPVNLQQAAFQAFLQNWQSAIASVFVLAGDGTKYFPRLESVDPATYAATFQMLDALPNGSYELHLSGPGGLADLAGNPLAGNDPSGDYVVHFTVDGPVRGDGDNPLAWTANEPGGGGASAQDLGALFPRELQAGVTVTRGPTPGAGDTQDAFRFEVLQHQFYTFTVQGSDALPSDALWLTDDQGNLVDFIPQGDGFSIAADLLPGVYEIHLGTWSEDQAADLAYQLHLTFLGNADNPIPLVAGPTPALQLRLNALPGTGGGATPSSPATPAPTLAAEETGGASSFPAYGPTFTSVATEHASDHGDGSGTAGASFSSTSTGSSPTGLIALSVAPVGGFQGSEASSAASTQVTFSLPSQAPALTTVGEGLVGLLTSLQVLGEDDPAAPIESNVGEAGAEFVEPAVVSGEAPPRIPEGTEISAEKLAAASTPEDAPPALESQDPGTLEAETDIAEVAAPEATDEEAEKKARAEIRLSGLAWDAAIAGFVSIAVVVAKRHQTSQSARSVPLKLGEAAREEKAPRDLAGPMGGLKRRTGRSKGLSWRRTKTARRGAHS